VRLRTPAVGAHSAGVRRYGIQIDLAQGRLNLAATAIGESLEIGAAAEERATNPEKEIVVMSLAANLTVLFHRHPAGILTSATPRNGSEQYFLRINRDSSRSRSMSIDRTAAT
jgi:hypothetical protein